MSNVDKGPQPAQGLTIPGGRVSSPDYVDWHMILDQELTQLSRPESGVIGALGFTSLGSALGLTPSAYLLWDKAPKDITHSDIVAGLAEAGTLAMGIVCLAIFGIASWRNRGLPTAIRARQRKVLADGASSSDV